MKEERNILDEYRQNDFFGRMHLFLQFRDLRGVFQEIEHKDLKTRGLTVVPEEKPAKEKCPEGLSVLTPLEEIK